MSELTDCYNALEAIAKSVIIKSDDGQHRSAKVEKAMRTTAATRTPAGAVLARRILQLEQQAAIRAEFAPVIKSMGLDREEEDEWSSKFSEADTDDEDELRRELREIQEREKEIVARIRNLHYGGR